MISLKPYPEYREPECSLIGETPSHWNWAKLGKVIRALSGGTPPMDKRDYWEPEVPWVSSKDMKTLRISSSAMWVSRSSVSDGKTTLAPEGSVLIVVRSGILRHTIPVAVTESAVAFNQDIKALLPRVDLLDSRYLAAAIRGRQTEFLTLWSKQGATVESLELPWMLETQIPVPPLDEQRAIADFLDVMDSRISRYIAAKRRMIALLEEQKQAIINQAVTRGLDPDVPLKPSGVDWLGDIPAHWEVKRLGSVMQQRQATNEQLQEAHILSVLSGRGVIPYSEKGNIGNKASEDITRYKIVKVGDIVLNSMNVIIGSLGRSSYDGCLSPVYYVLVPDQSQVLGEYLERIFQNRVFHASLVRIGNGILSHRMRIPFEKLKNETIPLPALDEQRQILDAIIRKLNECSGNVTRASNSIGLVEEYRTRLISDVVTGKLDVRGVELPAVEEYVDAGIEDALDGVPIEMGEDAEEFE